MNARVVARLALVLGLASGCGAAGGPAFAPDFPENDPARNERIRAQLAQAQPAPEAGPPLLLATTHGAQPELIAYDLGRQRLRFRRTFRADSRPELHGDLIVSSANDRLFALDAETGATRFSVPLPGCAYLGSARIGERLFFTCRRAGRDDAGEGVLYALDTDSGAVLFTREGRGALGRPVAAGGLLFAPFLRHSLAVIDDDGHELARVRIRDDVVEWVRADADGVLFGQERVHALSPRAPADAAIAGQPLLDTRALPGRPALQPSSFDPQSAVRSARGRVALHVQPELHDGAAAIADDRFYALFYRYVFAYSAQGQLLWAHLLHDDAVSARAGAAGLVIATENGSIVRLSRADGAEVALAQLGLPLAAAHFAGGELPAPAAAEERPPRLRRGLTEIALDGDSRLVPARNYAVRQLAALPEPDVTRDLLDIYAQSTTPPELKAEVADALRVRRSGLEHLVDALMARYDFLEQTRPAPLAVIVPALVEAHETRAVPLLLDRMFDPETPLPLLPGVVAAVAALGDATAVEPLLAFLRLYRADSSFAAEPDALLAAARGVLALGGPEAPARLTEITAGGRASPQLELGVAQLLAPARAAEAAPVQVAGAAPAAAAALPARLSQEAVNATFAEHIDDLRGCILEELAQQPELAQVRVAFVAESDGSAHAFSFVPNSPSFVDCAYPKVAGYRFPRFAGSRAVFRYVIALRTREPEPRAPDAQAEPWWQFYSARAQPTAPNAPAEPWWRSRQRLFPLAAPPQPQPAQSASTPQTPAAEAAPPPPAAAAAPPPAAPTTDGTKPAAPPAATPAEDAWWLPKQ